MEGRGIDTEKNIDVGEISTDCLLRMPRRGPRIEPTTRVCAFDWNTLDLTQQADALNSEANPPGPNTLKQIQSING